MKKNKLKLLLFPIAALVLSSFALANNAKEVQADDSTEYITQIADVSKFALVYDDDHITTATYDEDDQSLTTDGAWDSAFFSTNQFETRATSYSIKAHVSTTIGNVDDGIIGFNIYYNRENYVNFYLAFKQDMVKDTIAEAVFLCHVDDQYDGAYQYAKLPGGFITATTFTDIWSDFGGWGYGIDRESFSQSNLRGNSYIMGISGFDMTMYVDRIVHEDRLVDCFQYQIDAYEIDRVTPRTYFSPKYVIDAITNPKGVGERIYSYLKPKIGFVNNNYGYVTYSDIVFKHNNKLNTVKSHFDVVGSDPKKFEIDNNSRTITYDNTNFGSSFVSSSGFDTSSTLFSLSADIAGSAGYQIDTQIGFGIQYDDSNYLIVYFAWDGTNQTIDGVHLLITSNGVSSNVTQYARFPWDTSYLTQSNDFIDYWSDNGGFITDSEIPSGIDGNFDKFRQESRITISSGIRLGMTKIRLTYHSRLVDAYQLSVTATGLDDKVHSWYSPSVCIDAFTNPKGEGASPFVDVDPRIGFYACNTGEITIKNIQCNNDIVLPIDPSQIEFGTREEAGWSFTGSDEGYNWTYAPDRLSETWEDLEADSHKDEVTALTYNDESNFYFGAELLIERKYGSLSYVGLIPYYLDVNNNLYIRFIVGDYGTKLSISGVLAGQSIGGVTTIYSNYISEDIFDSIKVEVAINDNKLDIYVGSMIKPMLSYTFSRESFKDRVLTDSKIGFVFYNSSGEIFDYQKSNSRVFPETPKDTDIPIIYENGSRVTFGYVDKDVYLPIYSALNVLGESIEVVIEVKDPDGESVTLINNSFVPDKVGEYKVSITAKDEWNHEAATVSYSINVTKYVDPLTPIAKDKLWQTTFVIVFFSCILALTIALGIVLLRKKKKEAKISEELNRKKRERNEKELVDDEQ